MNREGNREIELKENKMQSNVIVGNREIELTEKRTVETMPEDFPKQGR